MKRSDPVNILLVDDQPGKLLSYEAILADLGENLIKANSGNQALEFLLNHKVAVVLVDVCMPDLDGFELTSMIRSHPRFQRTSIILVSGVMTEDVDRLRGYVSGAVDYVSVPIIPEILRAKISVFTELFRKTEALESLNQELELRVEQRTAALSEATRNLARAYEASRFLASIVESSADAIIGELLDGSIRTWNAAAERLFGYRAAEMLGRNAGELAPPDRAGEEASVLEKLRGGAGIENFETIRVRRDGTPIEVSLTVSPILDEEGNTIGASQFARDITEQKRAAESMRETQKLESLGVLAGGIAHDFNNLLVGILGNASLALESLPENSPERPLIQAVLAAGERAAGLTRQMLAYSGRGQFVLEAIDLSAFIRETIPLITAATPRSVKLQLDLAGELPSINADATQVQQILMNLVVNGAEAIAQGKAGTVRISTRRMHVDQQFLRAEPEGWRFELKHGDYVLLEVRDDGCGMDERTKSRIFEPFFTTKFTGRGLGLAAALGIVRGHSGSIHVSSSPGNGTTFRVLFPAMTAPQRRTVKPEQGRIESERGISHKGHVLVIDDEELVRVMVKRALEQHGYSVLLAANGDAALKLFRENSDRIGCLLLDLFMPVMAGGETLTRIKALRADVPVIVSSGCSEAEAMRHFDGCPLSGFIQKPYKASALLSKIKSVFCAPRDTSHDTGHSERTASQRGQS